MPEEKLLTLAVGMVFLPLVAGLIVLILPDTVMARLRELVATVAAAVTLWFAGTLAFGAGSAGSLVIKRFSFTLPGLDEARSIPVSLYLDRLSLLVVLAMTAIAFLVIVYAWGGMRRGGRHGEFFAYALWALGGANLAVLSDNLLVMLVGWEIASIMLFYLITIGGDRARHSAGKTMVMLGAADCALLLGIVMLVVLGGSAGMSISGLTAHGGAKLAGSRGGIMTVAFLLIVFGALTKAGAVPMHTWIPKAAEGAPSATMALLPGSLDKLLGIYLLARACLYMFDWAGAAGLQILLMLIGAITVVLAVMAALVQHDLKKLLSYHAVSQVGYMIMGIASGTALGVAGALFHMLNNAIYKCVLFLGAGAIEKRTGTTDLARLGGLGRRMPFTFGSMFIAALAISGVPLFNGFMSKWMIYGGMLNGAYAPPDSPYAKIFTVVAVFCLVAAMFGSALTLASFVKVLHSAFMGPATRECAAARPVSFSMWLPMLVMAALCVVLGVAPFLVYNNFLVPIVAESGLAAGPAGSISAGVMSFAPAAGSFWSPLLGAALVVIGLLAGGVLYMLFGVSRARVVRPFISGETSRFSPEDVRFPGTGFFGTVMEMGSISTIYRDAVEGAYDPYELLGSYGGRLVDVGRRLHDGVLPTYLAFCMLGLLAVLAALLAPLLVGW